MSLKILKIDQLEVFLISESDRCKTVFEKKTGFIEDFHDQDDVFVKSRRADQSLLMHFPKVDLLFGVKRRSPRIGGGQL